LKNAVLAFFNFGLAKVNFANPLGLRAKNFARNPARHPWRASARFSAGC
jgi:hypothetical protein